jgi:predicted DNA-binding protein
MDYSDTIMHSPSAMKSRGIRLSNETFTFLDEESERQGTNPTEIVRRAIDLYRDRSSDEFSNYVVQARIFFERENAKTSFNGLGDK